MESQITVIMIHKNTKFLNLLYAHPLDNIKKVLRLENKKLNINSERHFMIKAIDYFKIYFFTFYNLL